MEKLVMRKIFLLNLLDKSEGISLSELQLEMNLSRKTIRNELDNLLTDCYYSKEDIFIEKKNTQYYLVKKDFVNIELIKLKIREESILFKLYCNLVKNENMKSKDIGNQHFFSQTIIYKNLKLIKREINKNGVDVVLVNGNYQLEGYEIMIRFQAYHYFWEISKGMNHLVCENFKIKFQELLYKIELELGIEFTYINKKKLELWFWIIKIRFGLVGFVENDIKIVNDKIHSECIKKYLENFFYAKKNIKQNDELYFSLFILEQVLKKQIANKWNNEVYFSDYYMVRNFLNSLKKQFDVKTEFQEVSGLIYEALFYHQYLDIEFLANSTKEMEKINQLNKRFKKFFLKFAKKNNLKMHNITKLCNYFYNICFLVVNTKTYRPVIKILVSHSQGEFVELNIKKQLMEFKFNLQFENIDFNEADCIITDNTIQNYEYKSMYYVDMDTNKAKKEIYNKLLTIEKKKV